MQENNLTPIYLPIAPKLDSDDKPIGEKYALVYVSPNKVYGNETGEQLIEKYAKPTRKKPKKPFISSIHWSKDKIKGLTVNDSRTIAKGTTEEIMKLSFLHNHQVIQFNLFVPPQLEEHTKVGNSYFDSVLLLQCIEELTNGKLLSRRDNRPLKRIWNNTISLCVIAPITDCDILVIIKGSKAIVLCPVIKED